jgi:hypothetical protein
MFCALSLLRTNFRKRLVWRISETDLLLYQGSDVCLNVSREGNNAGLGDKKFSIEISGGILCTRLLFEKFPDLGSFIS